LTDRPFFAYKGTVNVGADRKVQDRSVAMRTRLLDAALECLVDKGYSATTTIDVANRAGVSRGAQLHHFPTKADLLTAAVEHLLQRRMAEFRHALASTDPGADLIDAGIDLLWSMFQGPDFVAWAELWIAARTDLVLAAAVAGIDERFTTESRVMFLELYPAEAEASRALFDIGRDFAFALMEGVALQRFVPRGQRSPSDYLDVLKQLFHMLRDGHGPVT
jgi:AcrR family transcriptional regulator